MRGRRHLALSLLSTSADTSERCPHTHIQASFFQERGPRECQLGWKTGTSRGRFNAMCA